MTDESHPPPPDMPDMGALLGMAMEVQQQLAAAKEQAEQALIEGQAGGGAVRIGVTGGWEFTSVAISPDAIDPDDSELLQDLVLAALLDAAAKVRALHEAHNPLAGMGLAGVAGAGFGPGFDLGALAGTFEADDPSYILDEDERDTDEQPGPEGGGAASGA
jgi:nucleoid-associated protein EbfC